MKKHLSTIIKHSLRIKYGGLAIFFLSLIIATRTYINYLMIKNEIANINSQTYTMQQKIAYTNNFLLKYQESEYVEYFLAHKNNILFDREYIIKLERQIPIDNNSTSNDANKQTEQIDDKFLDTPRESRRYFFKDKFNNI